MIYAVIFVNRIIDFRHWHQRGRPYIYSWIPIWFIVNKELLCGWPLSFLHQLRLS